MSDDPAPPRKPIPDFVLRLLAPYAMPHGAEPHQAAHQLEAFEVAYRESKNPLWVWRAIVACHAAGAPLPAWCMAYLARVGGSLWDRRPMPEALEMKVPGPGTVFTRLDDGDELILAERMHWYIKDGYTETNAKYLVAKDRNVSESTALRAWQKHRILFEESPPAP